MVTERQIQIIEFILNSISGAYAKEVANLVGITTRTLRNEINEINSSFEDGPIIISDNVRGYLILEEKQEFVRSFLFENKSRIGIVDDSRFIAILGYLLVGYQNKYDLSDQLFISEQTLYRNITSVKKSIKDEYGINLVTKSESYGISETEIEIRKFVYRLILKYQPKEEVLVENFLNLLMPASYEELKYKEVLAITKKVFSDSSNPISRNNLIILSSVIYFTLDREEYIPLEKQNIELSLLESNISKRLQNHFKLKKQPSVLLSEFISTFNIFDVIIDDFTRTILSEFADDVLEKYNYDIKTSTSLYENLLLHCEFMLRRIDEKYELENPLKSHIKNSYSFSFEMSMLIVPIIYKYKQVFLTLDEVSYVALYLEHFIQNLNQKIIVLLQDNPRKAVYNNTLKWLNDNFAEHLEIISCDKESNFFEFLEEKNTDLIISFEESSLHPVIPTYRIYNMPNSRDVEHMKELIYQIKIRRRFHGVINRCFSEDAMIVFEEEVSFEEVIRRLSDTMEYLDWIDNSEIYGNHVIDRESIYPTTMGNTVMMPHPIFCFAKKTCMAIGLLKESICMHGEEVKMIMLLGTEEKENDDITILFSLVDEIVKEGNLVSKLDKITTSSEVKKLLFTI